ncbi:uncharacterized protein KY384_000387 [Bacidia gigantensis]|uniref:uncharacterized protein n=1 Tax=Bacidia gigantensis TaxID=2732470 RepID=UPI001D04A367|nr:uncharacterized protein KY384_000387 [Bacidia gigantensis]KAG8526393.1 hypothetical protein KY384_000387 [Bacidia gigantensis]
MTSTNLEVIPPTDSEGKGATSFKSTISHLKSWNTAGEEWKEWSDFQRLDYMKEIYEYIMSSIGFAADLLRSQASYGDIHDLNLSRLSAMRKAEKLPGLVQNIKGISSTICYSYNARTRPRCWEGFEEILKFKFEPHWKKMDDPSAQVLSS